MVLFIKKRLIWSDSQLQCFKCLHQRQPDTTEVHPSTASIFCDRSTHVSSSPKIFSLFCLHFLIILLVSPLSGILYFTWSSLLHYAHYVPISLLRLAHLCVETIRVVSLLATGLCVCSCEWQYLNSHPLDCWSDAYFLELTHKNIYIYRNKYFATLRRTLWVICESCGLSWSRWK